MWGLSLDVSAGFDGLQITASTCSFSFWVEDITRSGSSITGTLMGQYGEAFGTMLRAAGFTDVRFETLTFGVVYLYLARAPRDAP